MELIRRGINYGHRLGGLGTRRQVPDASAYLRLIVDPEAACLFLTAPTLVSQLQGSGVTQLIANWRWFMPASMASPTMPLHANDTISH